MRFLGGQGDKATIVVLENGCSRYCSLGVIDS